MGSILFLMLIIMTFLIVVAGHDSQHLKKRTYMQETQPHRALTGRL